MKIFTSFNKSTIREIINSGSKNSLNLDNTSYYYVDDNNNIIEDMNILRDKYFNLLMSKTYRYEMSDEEYEKYKYRPKLFSYDKLGNEEYWYILLLLNDMTSKMEFVKKIIHVPLDSMLDTISEIIKREEKNIEKNKDEISKKIILGH